MSQHSLMHRVGHLISGCLMAVAVPLTARSASAETLRGFFPAHDLPKYVAEHWDLGSFDSSLNNAVAPNRRTFASAGLTVTALTADAVTLESNKLRVTVTVYHRNIHDTGLDEISVCYREQIKGKRGETAVSFLLTQFSADTPVIALAMPAYSSFDNPECRARAG